MTEPAPLKLDGINLDLLAWGISDAINKSVDPTILDVGLEEIKAALPAFLTALRSSTDQHYIVEIQSTYGHPPTSYVIEASSLDDAANEGRRRYGHTYGVTTVDVTAVVTPYDQIPT